MIILDAMFKNKNTADGNSQDFWFVYNNKFLRTGNWKQKSALFPKFFSCLASQIIHIRQQANITLIHGGRKVHIDDLQRKHNFKIIRYFFNTSKCATNHVISLEGYDGFIGQKYLMLWRQESWPFGPGWAAHITSLGSWTFRLPCSH